MRMQVPILMSCELIIALLILFLLYNFRKSVQSYRKNRTSENKGRHFFILSRKFMQNSHNNQYINEKNIKNQCKKAASLCRFKNNE